MRSQGVTAGRRFASLAALLIAGGTLGGCHSAFIQATVTNTGSEPISLFEVDYPDASFGSGELLPGAHFHYRFKVLGNGVAQISWTDAAGREHKDKGPRLHEGDEGTLSLLVGADKVSWQRDLHQAP